MTTQIMASHSGVFTPVLVDDADAERIGRRKVSIGSHGYPQIWDQGTVHLLHRWLLGLTVGDGTVTDHDDDNPFNCQRANLVITSYAYNSTKGRTGRGAYPTRSGRWHAQAKHLRKNYHLGTYDTEEEALEVVRKWRESHPYGTF